MVVVIPKILIAELVPYGGGKQMIIKDLLEAQRRNAFLIEKLELILAQDKQIVSDLEDINLILNRIKIQHEK